MKRLPVLISFLLFLALCASLSYWLLQWLAPATRPVVGPAPAERALPAMSAAANLFGGPTEVVSSTPIQLKGIIHAAKSSESIAIIGIEGKPARTLKVDAEVASGLVIEQINLTSIVVSDLNGKRELPLPAFSVQATNPPALKTETASQPAPPQ